MELELRLLAKQSEIQVLAATREQAIKEVVRVKAKLRSRGSKAETVADLAEVKLALTGVQARHSAPIQAKHLQRAEQYVAMSETALAEGNYDGASYLIGQAKASLSAADVSRNEQSKRSGKITTFSVPVSMTVKQRSNVRAGPGLENKVLYQLKPQESVMATGYRGLWVQIKGQMRPAGWVHYSLLKSIL